MFYYMTYFVDPLAYPRGFTHVRFHRDYTKITMAFEITV